jgi:hypothetical protein
MHGVKIGKNIVCCNGWIICGIKQELFHLISVIVMNVVIIIIWSIFIFTYFIHDGILLFGLPSKYL